MDNVRKETHVVSVMTQWPLETVALVRDEEDDRLLPASHSKAKTDGEGQKTFQGIRQQRGKLFRQ